MDKRKSFLLRVDPELWAEVEAWAAAELRSVNGQIEYLLRQAVGRRRGAGAQPVPAAGRPRGGGALPPGSGADSEKESARGTVKGYTGIPGERTRR